MIKCLICDRDFKNRTSLCNHINRIHSLNKKEYYDKYIKQENEGICKYKNCANNTIFIDIEHGYADCCCLEHTNLYRHGVVCNLNIPEVKEKAQKNSHTEEAKQKRINTNIKKYGNADPRKNKQVQEQMKLRSLKKWGVDNPAKSQDIKNKIKQTKKERYGDENYRNPEKAKQTFLEKYGEEHPMKSEQVKEKQRETCRKKYGEDYYMSTKEFREKSKETCQDKYGTDYWTQSKEFGQTQSKKFTPIEAYFAKLLEEANIEYIHEYKEERYPYFCDFYLPESDTFIEIHSYWMHKDHFYDKDNKEDRKILRLMKKIAKEKPIYNRAIQIWTISDIEKLECANKNKLNYIVLRNKDDINNWIEGNIKNG